MNLPFVLSSAKSLFMEGSSCEKIKTMWIQEKNKEEEVEEEMEEEEVDKK